MTQSDLHESEKESLPKLETPDVHLWQKRSSSALASLWNRNSHSAWRNSDLADREPNKYYPTATFSAIRALASLGAFRQGSDCEIKSSPTEILDSLLEHQVEGSDNWLDSALKSSSHTDPHRTLFAESVPLGQMFPALERLTTFVDPVDLETRKTTLTAGLSAGLERIDKLLLVPDSAASLALDQMIGHQNISPFVALSMLAALNASIKVEKFLKIEPLMPPDKRAELLARLNWFFRCSTDASLARHQVDGDRTYDPMSLAHCLMGLVISDPDVRKTPYFETAIRAVVESQQADGCWPDGASIIYDSSGSTLQQPSIGVAQIIAELCVPYRLLEDYDPNATRLLNIGMPALHRHAEYLIQTYHSAEGAETEIHGWCSDRVRLTHFVETWITATAARFFHRLSVAEDILQRTETLAKYITDPMKFERRQWSAEERSRDWADKIIDPDDITKPVAEIWTKLISRVQEVRDAQSKYIRPPRGATSILLYGPPGSGKTFFVKALSDHLGWPLVSLSPGHFISNGLDLIEATASEIFSELYKLKHCVILFDECDELFRDRDQTAASSRNILSFATACMLPKLQELYESRTVVFVLATNYLANIDKAVRRPGRFDLKLLWDRPDEHARKMFIRRCLMTSKATELNEGEIQDWSVKTNGWTFNELALSVNDGSLLTNPSTLDYVSWCVKNGEDELDASSVTKDIKTAIIARWEKLPNYNDELKKLSTN